MKGIFDELKEENGSELSNELKDILLKEIDTSKNDEGYYLDAFGGPISFNGIRQLKKPYTKLNLNPIQQKEIAVVNEDYYYFRKNYCKIVTKAGIDRPEPRGYQKRFEDLLVTGEDVLAFWPRQCVSGNTTIKINNKKISIKKFYEEMAKKYPCSNERNEIFIETISILENKYKVSSYIEENNIIQIHKTIKFKKFKVILENSLYIECSPKHILINEKLEEIHAEDSLNHTLITENGNFKVIKVIDTGIEENMYDLSVVENNELYFSNGILSHNSGKSVTVSTYLLWKAITTPNINIGIAANVQKLAVEVLDKIKKIYIEMPIWMQPGLISWNKKEIEFDNGTKIMTSATNSDSFRGFSIHLLYVDEVAFIRPSLWEEFSDAVFPAQDALAEKQTILSSTAGGLNHWYFLVEGARKGENGYLIAEADWEEVPRWNKDKTVKEPEQFKKEQIAKNGILYWNQNFANQFLGSSSTLISGEALRSIKPVSDEDIIHNSLFNGLRIFTEPEPGHYYIVTVDPKVDGADKVGIHVIDVTKLPFKQVASANLEETYMLIPSRIYDLGNYYNEAMIVVENNMDMNIADTLYYQYEYEGEIFVERTKKKNNRMGFRTTKKTKKIITSMLKKFIEEGLLIIKDKKTLEEMFNFIEKKNATYSAEEGYHDDLIMSLMLVFAPFISIKDWGNFRGFVELIEAKAKEREIEEQETVDFLDLGIAPDSHDGESEGFTRDLWED